jgi:hypothetical protein
MVVNGDHPILSIIVFEPIGLSVPGLNRLSGILSLYTLILLFYSVTHKMTNLSGRLKKGLLEISKKALYIAYYPISYQAI